MSIECSRTGFGPRFLVLGLDLDLKIRPIRYFGPGLDYAIEKPEARSHLNKISPHRGVGTARHGTSQLGHRRAMGRAYTTRLSNRVVLCCHA